MEHIGNCLVNGNVGQVFAEIKVDEPLETKIELHLPNNTLRSTLMSEIAADNYQWKDAISLVAQYVNQQLSILQH